MGLNQEIESQRIEPGYNQTGKKKKKKRLYPVPESNYNWIWDKAGAVGREYWRSEAGPGSCKEEVAQCKNRGAEQMEINERKPLMIVWADRSQPACRRKPKTSHSQRLLEQQGVEWSMPWRREMGRQIRPVWKHWCTGLVLGSIVAVERQDNHLSLLTLQKKPL